MTQSLSVLLFVFACLLGSSPAQAQNVMLVSGMGGKCLNAAYGTRQGAQMIGYSCGTGAANEIYWFNGNPDGSWRITQANYCLDIRGGLGRAGDPVDLWPCNGGANQKWRYVNHQLVGQNGLCLDLSGGTAWSPSRGNQPAIVWPCNGGPNQKWFKGIVVTGNRVRLSGAPVRPGQMFNMSPVGVPAWVIAAGGGNVIAAGGGNVIPAGAGNVIPAGAGNVIAAGGGNFIVLAP